MRTKRITSVIIAAALSLTLGAGLCGCSAETLLKTGIPAIDNALFGNDAYSGLMSDSEERNSDRSPDTSTVDVDNVDSLSWDETIAPNFWYDAGASSISTTQQSDLESTGKTSAFDSDGYVLVNGLRVTSDTIAYGKRGREDISDEDVRGWPHPNEKASVTFASGKNYSGYFWNRSHLVAHMLGGEDEAANLVTGTRAQNVGDNSGDGGMQYCEYLAYDYVTEHEGVYVDYVATACYRDGENIPRAVIVNMKSSDGGLDKQIVVYNAMPGYQIDYITGEVTAE